MEVWRYDGSDDNNYDDDDDGFSRCHLELVRLRQAVFTQLKPLCPALTDVLMGQLHQYLSQKAFVFGEQTSTVLHCDIQSPPVELHEGNTELKRLIVNWIEGFLERVSFPPARPPFVRKQVEANVRI